MVASTLACPVRAALSRAGARSVSREARTTTSYKPQRARSTSAKAHRTSTPFSCRDARIGRLTSVDVLSGVLQRPQRHVDYSVVTSGPLRLLGLVASVCIAVIFWDWQAAKDLNPGDLYLVRIVVRRVAGLGKLVGEPVRIDECFLGRTPWHVQACRSEMDILLVNDDRHFEGHE